MTATRQRGNRYRPTNRILKFEIFWRQQGNRLDLFKILNSVRVSPCCRVAVRFSTFCSYLSLVAVLHCCRQIISSLLFGSLVVAVLPCCRQIISNFDSCVLICSRVALRLGQVLKFWLVLLARCLVAVRLCQVLKCWLVLLPRCRVAVRLCQVWKLILFGSVAALPVYFKLFKIMFLYIFFLNFVHCCRKIMSSF
jgi:hypothetical protein